MQAVMITMGGREGSALETAERLAEAGVSTEIFVQPDDWPVGGVGNNRNSRRALAWARDNVTGPGVLFVEDDLLVKTDRLRRAIKSAEDTSELMYFYMHDIPPRTDFYPREEWIQRMVKERQYKTQNTGKVLASLVVPEGPRLMKHDARMFGAQCVYIPRQYIPFLYAHMDHGYEYTGKIKSTPSQAIDTSLNNWRLENKLPAYCYLPHPVQHLQNRTRRHSKRNDVFSGSYDLVSDLEVERDGVRAYGEREWTDPRSQCVG